MTNLLLRRRNATVAVVVCMAGLLLAPAAASGKVYFTPPRWRRADLTPMSNELSAQK